MKQTIGDKALLVYPVWMADDHNYPQQYDANETDRNTWIDGAEWNNEQLQPVITKLQEEKAELVNLMKKMQQYLWADPERVFTELDKAIKKVENK